ncbi:MAG TPA: NAD-dependent epimerase/dehydratase family protein [Terrimicrobiaceae bacterium]|nr:NAD-dependent epimerase/dehydratase family protein [Terrimicrobiaceae bacterium]
MKVLVTGGTGLLSGPLVSALLQRGAEVTIFHRSSSGGNGPVRELTGDRTDYPEFVATVRAAGPWDCLVEMIGGVPGDAQSLIAAARGIAPHVIFCSTTTVYGRPFARVPVREEGALLDPPSPYGEGKLECERLLRAAEADGDFAVTIMRPAHIYNERSLMLHSLGNRTSHLDRILQGRPIIVHDDGTGLWSSLWAADAAAALAAAVYAPAARGKTYHLAGSEIYSWNAYHALLARALGAPAPRILHVSAETLAELAPARSLQCLRTLRHPGVYDCSEAGRDLDFRPEVPSSEGLVRNVQALRDRERIESWTADGEYEQIVQSVQGTL